MAFHLKEYLKEKPDPANVPELVCERCQSRFPVYLGTCDPGFQSVRFACEKCADLLVFSGDGLYACLDVEHFGASNVRAVLEKNLKPCPADAGRFRARNEIYCPDCHHVLPEWIWSYYLVSKLGDQAFLSPARWKDYVAFGKALRGDALSYKKIVEKAWTLGREGEIRFENKKVMSDVRSQYYLVSRSCYQNEEWIASEPSRDLLEMLARTLEKGGLEEPEEVLREAYDAAFYLAKLSGRMFERAPDMPPKRPQTRFVVSSESKEAEAVRRHMERVVAAVKKKSAKIAADEDVAERLRIEEMRSKISAVRDWWRAQK